MIARKITRFGYIVSKASLDEKTLNEIKTDLTVKPYIMASFDKFKKDNSFPLYIENGDYISIPKYYGIEKLGNPEINKLNTYLYPTYDINYMGFLRPAQQIIVDKIINGFNTISGGLLIAGCGSGKTNMAIYIACYFKLKTLFIVHKTFLKNQCINRIKSTTNVKNVGIIQQRKVDIDHPFVVGMVQSISKINYNDEIFKDFGLIIIDEVHHMGARNFSKLYQKISTKYMLGISAERSRNDGMYQIINWYMGPILHAEEQKPNNMVVVKRFHYHTDNQDRMETLINKHTKEPNRPAMITNLIHIRRRNRFVMNLIKILYDMGKNILFLSSRLKQVRLFYRMLSNDKYIGNNIGKYIGGMSEQELAISATKQIILGTYDMAQEGLDIGHLNVVILGTPKSSIKQSVGRILRKDVYEENPIVIDIIDSDNRLYVNQSNTRKKYYDRQHFHIQNFSITDYPKKDYIDWNDFNSLKEILNKAPPAIKPSVQRVYLSNTDDIDFLSD
jgi:superfamily II DNA or RNA helicase